MTGNRFLSGRDTTAALVWGFGTMLFLIIALGVLALVRMASLNEHLNAIVDNHIARTDLIAKMRDSARERSIALHRMAVMTDPLAREEEYLHFIDLASEFLQAKARLEASSPGPHAVAAMERVWTRAQAAGVVQNQVINAIKNEQLAAANDILVMQAVPAQNDVMVELSNMLELQRQTARSAVAAADRAYRNTYALMLALGVTATTLGLLIAVGVIRRTGRIESALAAEKTRAEVTLQSIGDAVITADVSGCVEHLNKAAEAMTGWSEAAAKGMPLHAVLNVVRAEPQAELVYPTALAEGGGAEDESSVLLMSRDGREFTIEQSVAAIRDAAEQVAGSVVVFRDVSRSHELSRKLSWAARHDALTGLPNRREFEHRLAAMLDSAQTDRKQHAMLYLDLDQFKVVNDTCGHIAGDELLRQLAGVMVPKLRGSDTLARLGGDEFGLLLEGCTTEKAMDIAEKIRQAVVEFRFVWQDKVFEIGASIGVVGIDETSTDAADIMSAADTACYEAKDQGRNRAHLYLPDDEVLSQRRGEMNWVQRISRALERQTFCLFRQAIAPAGDAATTYSHYEILIRMIGDDGSLVPPMAFIPAAERYNLMTAIDRWVVRTVIDHMTRTADGRDIGYSINLSGQSLGDPQQLDYIVSLITSSEVVPHQLCFEITETAAIANLARAAQFIATLRALGCRFSLDDFGSGMSSLAYLKNLPVDYLKIDGAFVRDIADDPIDFAMVGAINSIAHVMKIKTIAEFVENQSILDRLNSIGVDYCQGYFIHKPEPLPGVTPCNKDSTVSPRQVSTS